MKNAQLIGSILSLFILLNSYGVSKAQSNLGYDHSFYLAQVPVYQDWLDSSGIGKYLRVDTLTVDTDTVNLYLSIPSPYTDREDASDYVLEVWRKLRSEYKKENSIGLETQLFLKMMYIMDLEYKQFNIQLYDTYDVTIEPYVFFGICHKNHTITLDSNLTRASHHNFPITIPAPSRPAQTQLNGSISSLDLLPVYDKIIQFFQQYPAFKNANVREKFPADLQQGIYSIQVAPVYGEVLSYQRTRPICLFLERLGFKCGDEERLYFTFTFTPMQRGSYNVKCLFDGKLKRKVGQQVKFVVFDKKFDKYLEDYGSKLITALRQYLK